MGIRRTQMFDMMRLGYVKTTGLERMKLMKMTADERRAKQAN